MDFLNQAIAQVRELFQSMTPAGRVTAVLLAGVIGVSLGFLVQQQGAGPDEYLFNGEFLPTDDANRAEAAIAQAGLTGSERIGNRIKVPHGEKAAYLAAVAEAGALPPNFHSLLENALDLGAFVDDRTRRERLKAAREQQLSLIIRAMSGIEDAKVIYDTVEPRGLSREAKASATVSVQPVPGEPLSPKRVKLIRQAVAGAIANLNPQDVEVVNLGDGTMFGEEITPESFDSPYYQHKVAYERHMKSNIENLLAYIPGIRVQVTAELDQALTKQSHSISVEGEPAAVRESTETRQQETQHINQGGRPGLYSQGPSRTNEPESDVVVKNTESNDTSDTNSFIPTKNEDVTEAGLIPQAVRVAIAVPKNYLVQTFREQQRRKGEDPNQPLPDEIETTLSNLETILTDEVIELVAPLLPKELAVQQHPNVKLSFFETLTPEPIESIAVSTQALAWLNQNFSTLTMAGIALVSLVMLRSLVKGIPTAEPLAGASAPLLSLEVPASEEEGDDSEEDFSKSVERRRPRLKLKKGKTLRDELTEIVQEDPDSAAAILRSWINNAA